MGENSALGRRTLYVHKQQSKEADVGKSNLGCCLISSAKCSNQVPPCKMGLCFIHLALSIKPLACIDELL